MSKSLEWKVGLAIGAFKLLADTLTRIGYPSMVNAIKEVIKELESE